MAIATTTFMSCSDNDDDNEVTDNTALKTANEMFVNTTVVPTYEGLASATTQMISAIETKNINGACSAWKSARQYWEWSEAFLFGAASGYGIDPHIDTWPFDAASFNNYMAKYNPSENEADAAILEEAIATGQGLTGFHAIEYLLFRDGKARTALSDNEWWFCETAANDLYLASSKLVAAWGGKLSNAQKAMLEEAEFEYDDFGEEFTTNDSRRWRTALASSVQIIEGCQDIIDEVAHSKIGAPNTGEDVNYIESPHAYNSIQDFYDNIQSCKHALYGFGPSESFNPTTPPAVGSLMAYCQKEHSKEAATAMTALESALSTIKAMKAPFVLYYQDASATRATEALEVLDEALDDLKKALE